MSYGLKKKKKKGAFVSAFETHCYELLWGPKIQTDTKKAETKLWKTGILITTKQNNIDTIPVKEVLITD